MLEKLQKGQVSIEEKKKRKESTRGGYKSSTLVGRKKNAIMDEKAKSVDVGSMHGDQIMPRGAHGQGWAEPDAGSASIGL